MGFSYIDKTILAHIHKNHVPSMLAIGVETINKQTQQTNKQAQWLIKFIKLATKGLEK